MVGIISPELISVIEFFMNSLQLYLLNKIFLHQISIIMNNLRKLMTEIIELTANIEANYPELYKYLDESPATIPNDPNPVIDRQVLEAYLKGIKKQLKDLLMQHKMKFEEK